MVVDANTLTLISACTALAASVAGPGVSLMIARRQINANLVSANRQRWIETLRDLVAEMISLLKTGAYVKLALSRNEESFTPSTPTLLEKVERLMLVKNKIRLLINPTEADHRALLGAIETALARVLQPEHQNIVATVDADVETITQHAQLILKNEWGRVKRGE